MFSLRPYRQNNGHQKNALSKFARNFLGDDFEALFENVDNFPSSFRVDLRETDNQYVLEADLPGINKEDISLHYEKNYLTKNSLVSTIVIISFIYVYTLNIV